MIYEKILLRLLSSGLLRKLGRRVVHRRVWTIQGGEGAGLKLKQPQNLDYISGTSEIPVQQALTRHLRPGEVFYDIGANMGFFSLIAGKHVGPTGCVCSFEPVAENAASVRENSRLNGLQNVRLFEAAVGRNSGTAELLLTEWDGGGSLSTSAVKPSAPVSRRNVRVVALDDFIPAENLPRPDFVKIDVEGVELEVMQGMSKTIAESKPVLLYEVDDGKKQSFERRWKELDDYVAAFGYHITHLKPSYPDLVWNVGHSLALPHSIQGEH
jgi:FkbM family methyltransferase